jgi:hypothetical protein
MKIRQNMIKYRLADHNLIIEDSVRGEVVWEGRPLDCPVEEIIPLSGEHDCLVLLSYYEFSQSDHRHLGNLLRLHPDGTIAWTAEVPHTGDVYVQFSLTGDFIKANTWSGFLVLIDINNGKILKMEFVK